MRASGSDVATKIGRQLLNMAEVTKRTSLSRSTIYSLLKRGEFPRRVRCGRTSRIAFSAADVDAWIADQERIASESLR